MLLPGPFDALVGEAHMRLKMGVKLFKLPERHAVFRIILSLFFQNLIRIHPDHFLDFLFLYLKKAFRLVDLCQVNRIDFIIIEGLVVELGDIMIPEHKQISQPVSCDIFFFYAQLFFQFTISAILVGLPRIEVPCGRNIQQPRIGILLETAALYQNLDLKTLFLILVLIHFQE